MPPKRKVLAIYPDPTTLAIMGWNTPAGNRAATCWAEILKRSEPELTRDEWMFLATAYRKHKVDDETVRYYQAGDLAHRVAEEHLLYRTGDTFAGNAVRGDTFVTALVTKCKELTWEQVQFVLASLAFFVYRKTDSDTEDWWTLPFRVQMLTGGGV